MKTKVFFITLFLILTIYQDFPLINVFGEIARSPIFLLALPMLMYIFSFKKVLISKYLQYLIYYLIYVLCISCLYLPGVFFYNGSLTFLDENLFVKAIKSTTYVLLIFVYYQFVYTFLSKEKDAFLKLFYAIFIVQIFITIFLIFEIYYLNDPIPFIPEIHATDLKYWRVRLITMEESTTGSLLVLVMFLPVFLANYLNLSKKLKITTSLISVFIFVFYTIFSESKGYLFLVLISVLPLFIAYIYKDKKLRKFLYIVGGFFLIGGIAVTFILLDVISSNYTSGTFGTRFGSYLIGLNIFVQNPLGVGYGSYTFFYPQAATEVMELSFLQNLNFNELSGYLNTAQNQSTKTFFFDHLIYGGIGFVIFCYYFFVKRFHFFARNVFPSSFLIKVPFIFVILAGLVYITYDIKYEVWFLFAFLDVLENKFNNESK